MVKQRDSLNPGIRVRKGVANDWANQLPSNCLLSFKVKGNLIQLSADF